MPQHVLMPEEFPNQLGILPLSSTDITKQVSTFSLEFIKVINEEVENGIRFPEFAKAFYNFIFKYKRVPNQSEFFNFYLIVNKNFFVTDRFSKDIMTGLKARVYRAYPSLVRDFHFSKLLAEKVTSMQVVYNIDLDIEHDIDTLLQKGDNFWAACLYTQTRRANIARDWKENRHIRFSNVNYIEFPVELDDSKKVGDFFLYGETEIIQLLNAILS